MCLYGFRLLCQHWITIFLIKKHNNVGIIGYIGENNWVHGRKVQMHGSVKRAVQNRIIGEFWSTLASPLCSTHSSHKMTTATSLLQNYNPPQPGSLHCRTSHSAHTSYMESLRVGLDCENHATTSVKLNMSSAKANPDTVLIVIKRKQIK